MTLHPGTMTSRQRGFTLLELLIVVAVIAVIASIAIPNLISSRLSANESAAIATLKAVSSAQAEIHASGAIDVNNNGTGEYGYLAELSGGVGLRNSSGAPGAELSSPPPLSPAFANVVPRPPVPGGVVERSGYLFLMFLPDPTNNGIPEALTGGVNAPAPDPVKAEVLWCCYAWPASFNKTGGRAFFVNQRGEVLTTRNRTQRYSGATQYPAWTAAFAQGDPNGMAGRIASGVTAQDGQLWYVAH